MLCRNDSRDAWKLAHWAEFSAQAQFVPPRDDLYVLPNRGRAQLPDLVNQVLYYLNSK